MLRRMLVVTILSAALYPAPCRADAPDAEAAIERGLAFRRLRRDADALVEFRVAYAIAPTARALAQIALAEAALERWAAAEADLGRALAAEDPWIVRQRDRLNLAQSEIAQHLGTLLVLGPDGADVSIDGEPVARLPHASLRVAARHVSVDLKARGFRPVHKEVDLPAGAATQLVFALEPIAAPATPPAAVHGLELAAGAEGTPMPGASQRTVAWVTASSAIAFGGAGIALTIVAAGRASEYNGSNCDDLGPTLHRSQRCAEVATAFHEAETGYGIAYALAGAAAVATTVLFLTLPNRDRARIAAGPGMVSISCDF